MKFKVACIQINSINDIGKNLERARELVSKANERGADFILLPENVGFMSANPEEAFDNAHVEAGNPILENFMKLAAAYRKWLLIGSISIKQKTGGKLLNRSYLIDFKGDIVEVYDKIHLYDVDVQGGERHMESDMYEAGYKEKKAMLPWGQLGMSICYDLRFPNLYRKLAQSGAEFLAVPSAFTKFTGQAHWHTLLRARAIENGAYVFAPAQTGRHPSGRETFGHALIVDPWGRVVSDCGENEGFIMAEIDPAMCSRVRRQIPSLNADIDL